VSQGDDGEIGQGGDGKGSVFFCAPVVVDVEFQAWAGSCMGLGSAERRLLLNEDERDADSEAANQIGHFIGCLGRLTR
jgi:hypothetical protein